jgi:hydrogenase maturation protein HypF
MLSHVLADIEENTEPSLIAWKIFCSLAKLIANASEYFSIRKIAFSGGVFQNELLTELVIELLSQKNELYFHHQLSPNDECIGFGQIACYELFKRTMQKEREIKRTGVLLMN